MNDINLIIQTNSGSIIPSVLEGLSWETERKEVPGKLTFKCLFDKNNIFEEGDIVTVSYKGTPFFYGYIFTISRDKNGISSVTAYDQLRYLKNKDIYDYRNKKASDVIKILAADFKLTVGDIEDTKYIIPKRLEDNVSLFDIIQTALGITVQNTKKLYVLYDDVGKLTLKDIEKMKLDITIDGTVSENYNYKTSIENSYNQIKLIENNKAEGKRKPIVFPDAGNIIKWGVLQYFDKIEEKENIQMKGNTLLQIYNRKGRTLSIKNIFGDIRVRAGTSVIVRLDLGDVQVSNFMLVEKVKHTFKFQEHFMDLTLRGGDIG